MPVITIDGPKMTTAQKRKIVENISTSLTEILEIPKNAITVLLNELSPENVGFNGKLISET